MKKDTIMKKLLTAAALFATATLFASGHASGSAKCDLKYNHCMADCAVKYGSDRTCIARCSDNYHNCKAGLKTEDYTPQKAAASQEAAPAGEEKSHH